VAVFDWVESPGTGLEEEPRVARTSFGDGYEECAPAGLNPLRQRWTLNFRAVEKSVGDDIVAFLRARVGALGIEPFDWAPLWATGTIRVRCARWGRTQTEVHGETDITAVFDQVFGA